MSLTPGSRIGVYDVVEMIGVGGMGEVYRAKDSRLDRDVALKTLPDEFARDPERLARFEREAKSLAQLNHPHIASIYGLETGSPTALAMEMVEGETLADRLKAGPLSLDEAIAIARQLCDALDHAHSRGIVHRDLKPANIKAGPRDTVPHVKVLDFGLARAFVQDLKTSGPQDLLSSPTITSPANMTRAGIILGTAAYMAPEQARGKQVDQRADIWAFGCVLFEMISGRRPFDGEEMTDVLARVIQSEPDWALLPATTPRAVKTLLQRCLRKDPAKRIHSIADAGIDLEDAGIESGQAEIAKGPSRRWPSIVASAALSAALVAVALLTIGMPRGKDAARTIRFSIQMPDGWTIFRNVNSRPTFAISPDGQKLAVILTRNAERSIFLRRLDETTFRRLSGTLGATNVFWAPDSERLGFALAGVTFRKTDLNGAGSQQIAAIPDGNPFAIWGPRDEVISGRAVGTLLRWSLTNPVPMPVGELPEDVTGQYPLAWLPNGEVMYGDLRPEDRPVMVRPLSGAPRHLTTFPGMGFSALYSFGHLLIASSDAAGRSAVTAQPLDLATHSLTGEIVVLVDDANPVFSASDNGVLVTAPGLQVDDRFVWLDARGVTQSTITTGAELRRPTNFDLSPDGGSLVIQQAGPANPLVVHDLARGVTTALSVRGTDPVWSPDGRQIAFPVVSGPNRGIHIVPAFGGASRLIHSQAEVVYLDDWSRDGKWLAGHVTMSGHGILVSTNSDAKPIMFEQGGLAVDETAFSPDVRWLAYNGGQGQNVNVYLTAVPPTGERWQISVAGGAQPRWRADGKALYFLSLSGTMMMVDFQAAPGGPPRISAPRALFDAGLQVAPALDQYRVNANGTRFLVRRSDSAASAASNQLDVIVNWPGLLKK